MPGDAGEKTEAPTPRRLQDAREKGQVAKSTDLSAALGLLAGLLLIKFYGPTMSRSFMDALRTCLTLHELPNSGSYNILSAGVVILLKHLALVVLPFLLVLFVVAAVANLAQVGFLFTAQPITPNLEKISPLAGFKRMFSLRTAVRMGMNLAKVAIITVVAYYTIKSFLPQLIGAGQLSYLEVDTVGADLMFSLGLRLAAVLLVLALIDFAYQKYQLMQELRMSRQELLDDLKNMEGDPETKNRRRNVARQLAQQRMSQAVPEADVVVTNPTHLAIALKYDHKTMPAPKVVARGAGFMAQRIRQIANENGIPIVERKPLARALYKACQVGDYVPAELYQTVAEVLAYVFELAGKGFRRSRAVTA